MALSLQADPSTVDYLVSTLRIAIATHTDTPLRIGVYQIRMGHRGSNVLL